MIAEIAHIGRGCRTRTAPVGASGLAETTPAQVLRNCVAFFDSYPMQNTETELYRDAIAQITADKLTHEQVKTANLLAESGEAFNIAIWASIKLNELARQ